LPVISNEGVRHAARRRMRPDARRQSLAGLGPAPRVAAGPGRRHGCRRLPEERRSGWSPVVRPASSIPGPVLPREPVRWRAPPARRARVCRGQAEPTCPRADPPFGRRPAVSPLRPTQRRRAVTIGRVGAGPGIRCLPRSCRQPAPPTPHRRRGPGL